MAPKTARTTLRWPRCAGAVAVALLAALTLSGCFIIPLADGRSPFDDPSGASYSDIEDALPDIQHALDDIDTHDGAWLLQAETGVDRSCEGACNLHVWVTIAPDDDLDDPTVPEEVLRDVLVAVVPAAEQHRVDVRVSGGLARGADGDLTGVEGDLSRAATQLFGMIPESGILGDSYFIGIEPSGDVEIIARTRDNTEVLQAMPLE